MRSLDRGLARLHGVDGRAHRLEAVLQADERVVGRDDLQPAVGQRGPAGVAVGPELRHRVVVEERPARVVRRPVDLDRGLVPEVVLREAEVGAQRLAVERQPLRALLGERLDPAPGRHVQDVQRRAGALGQEHRAPDRRLLDDRPAHLADVRAVGLALAHVLAGEPVGDRVVLGVHDAHAAVLGDLDHRAVALAVVAHVAVGHHRLDRRDAVPDRLSDLLDLVVGEGLREDRVEGP